jgi:hypothetical protein
VCECECVLVCVCMCEYLLAAVYVYDRVSVYACTRVCESICVYACVIERKRPLKIEKMDNK